MGVGTRDSKWPCAYRCHLSWFRPPSLLLVATYSTPMPGLPTLTHESLKVIDPRRPAPLAVELEAQDGIAQPVVAGDIAEDAETPVDEHANVRGRRLHRRRRCLGGTVSTTEVPHRDPRWLALLVGLLMLWFGVWAVILAVFYTAWYVALAMGAVLLLAGWRMR